MQRVDRIGFQAVNNTGDVFTIIAQDGRLSLVEFRDTGSTRWADTQNVMCGKCKDLYKPSRYGVGFEGDFDRAANPAWRKARDLWSNMLKRCYCETDPRGYFGKGITVAPRWHNFSLFVADLQHLAGYPEWASARTPMNLDKDLLVPGNVVYSPDTCMFISEHMNKGAGKRGKKLIGGCWVVTSA